MIWRLFGGLFSLLFLIVVVFIIKDLSCSDRPYTNEGWSDQVLDVQKTAIIGEFPNATNEQRSEILILRAEIERLELVRDGKLDPDWRPPGWTDPFKEKRRSP